VRRVLAKTMAITILGAVNGSILKAKSGQLQII